MKIYTKRGDKGETSLIGGVRTQKDDIQVECYGTVDELNSNIGLLSSLISDKTIHEQLLHIQNTLFVLGAFLATSENKHPKIKDMDISDIKRLEKHIDEMDKKLEVMTHFVLPRGSQAIAQCHICRCVCRRGERIVVKLSRQIVLDPIFIQYLNRLSDYLFVLARFIAKISNTKEVKWIAKSE